MVEWTARHANPALPRLPCGDCAPPDGCESGRVRLVLPMPTVRARMVRLEDRRERHPPHHAVAGEAPGTVSRRPSPAVLDSWAVVGAVFASLAHAALRFQRPALSARLGLGYPLLSLFVLWAAAIALQAACWWVWSTVRKSSSK